jgi:hypothetical protein
VYLLPYVLLSQHVSKCLLLLLLLHSFYEKLEQDFYHIPKYQIKILLWDFNVKLEEQDVFKPTIGMRAYIRIIMIMLLE